METNSCPECGRAYGKRRRCYYCHGRPRVGNVRRCIDCGEPFEVPKTKDRAMSARCLVHRREYNAKRQAAWRQRHPDKAKAIATRHNRKRQADPEFRRKVRAANHRKAYGIEPEEFDAMVAKQGGVCAICGLPPRGKGNGKHLHVDHCHVSGPVRGLLCSPCNTALGLFDDNSERLQAAIRYLER